MKNFIYLLAIIFNCYHAIARQPPPNLKICFTREFGNITHTIIFNKQYQSTISSGVGLFKNSKTGKEEETQFTVRQINNELQISYTNKKPFINGYTFAKKTWQLITGANNTEELVITFLVKNNKTKKNSTKTFTYKTCYE